jgi:hypothetical protein
MPTTNENIAGKACTVETYRYTQEPNTYWRFGYWNGIQLLSEGTYIYNKWPDGSVRFTVFIMVAQKIVTDVPGNAFDPNADVTTWMK